MDPENHPPPKKQNQNPPKNQKKQNPTQKSQKKGNNNIFQVSIFCVA